MKKIHQPTTKKKKYHPASSSNKSIKSLAGQKKEIKPVVFPAETAKDPDEIKRQLRQIIKKVAINQGVKKDLRGTYLYLYDPDLRGKPYRAILSNIESRLSDFEIMDKVVRLSTFSNPRLIVEDEMRHGVKNVIVVGNDETLARILTRTADMEVTFGFLPVGQKKNYLAKILGLPLNEAACEVIAARKIEKIDYGTINKSRFFLSYLYIPATGVRIACDSSFTINKSGKEKIELAVSNLLPPPFASEKFQLHPQDGQMELYLRLPKPGLLSSLMSGRQRGQTSIFPFRHLRLTALKPMTVLADGKETQELSVEIEVAKKKLRMIVGKNREF